MSRFRCARTPYGSPSLATSPEAGEEMSTDTGQSRAATQGRPYRDANRRGNPVWLPSCVTDVLLRHGCPPFPLRFGGFQRASAWVAEGAEAGRGSLGIIGAMNEPILREARRLADEVFRPHAEEADQGGISGQVGRNIRLLADAGYFGLGIGPEFGGFGADDATRREYTELMASACGVTAFVQQQLHAGGGFVGGGQSESLKREKLPLFAAGRELCGVAFSHLRRPGTPMVRAERVPGGFEISGVAPWVTGWSLLDSFILGASLPDDRHLFAYIPKAGNESTLTAGPRIPLVVMNASDTVEVTLDRVLSPTPMPSASGPPRRCGAGTSAASPATSTCRSAASGAASTTCVTSPKTRPGRTSAGGGRVPAGSGRLPPRGADLGRPLRRPAGLQGTRPADAGDGHRPGRARRPRRRRRHRRQRPPP